MNKYFPEITKPIRYEGPDSRNPLAFRHYDATRRVGARTMAQHLRFAVAYWHTFRGTGADPFGGEVYRRPWNEGRDAVEIAEKTLDAAFEFFSLLGVPFYCFHDRDLSPEGDTLAETHRLFDRCVERAERRQRETGVRLLWGTANLFAHPRYTHGAATNPDPRVFAVAASQVRHALEATHRLGGAGYVFWGGREGYSSLLNTDLKQEREQLARFLHLAVDHRRKIGFRGAFFIEPKPKEPTAHQYDSDAATVLGFLREFDLLDAFELNIEANHATLAGHTFEHELAVASAAGKLGSMDVNRGDPTLGWDTDQFPTDLNAAVWAMSIVLRQGGLPRGGLNFDAKVRRGSFDPIDLFHAHIGAMDTFARALVIADRMRRDGFFERLLRDRYAGFRSGIGRRILKGELSLADLDEQAQQSPEPSLISGRQEYWENRWNDYLFSADRLRPADDRPKAGAGGPGSAKPFPARAPAKRGRSASV